MKVLQFYTSTGMRDRERMDAVDGLWCPNWMLLPFQIQRPASSSTGLTSALLVDCSGNTTNILSQLTQTVHEKTVYDFITYNGEAFDTEMSFGSYYVQASDGVRTWYSDWIDVRNIQPTLLTGWTTTGYTTFTVAPGGSRPNVDILQATSAGAASADSNAFAVNYGERFYLTSEYTINSDSPGVNFKLIDSSGNTISNTISLTDGEIKTDGMTARATDSAAQLRLSSSEGDFAIDRLSLRRYQGTGRYIHIRMTNTKDLQGKTTLSYNLPTEKESIFYASGFTQQMYLNAYMGPPDHEVFEIGTEKNGVFEAEKLVDKYVHNIIAYEPKTVFNSIRLLPMHDTIQIYDRVGNQFLPDAGNVRIQKDQTTFDVATLRISFNEDNPVWTHTADNIT